MTTTFGSRARFSTVRLDSKSIQNGVTLAEVLIIVVILGVLGVLGFASLNSFLQREKANAVALAYYGWLNEVRQASLRLQGNGQSCTVVVKVGSYSGGQEIASVPDLGSSILDNTECRTVLADKKQFFLDRGISRGLPVAFAANSTQFTYTPRTLTTNAQDVVVGLVVNSRSPLRCIKISAVSGFLQIGRNDTSANQADSCTFSVIRAL
jgi:Tfp pilus assembly protein FimT